MFNNHKGECGQTTFLNTRLTPFQDGLPEEGTIQARLRERAVPMLCAMAHSTQRGRAALGAADGAGVLLGLLRDPPYQVHTS
jgi:catechol 2,3-dioxygenase-like lactoylglutathione lyase family enzyme